ncbi:MAG: hypothetical protein IT379_36960 [Deltaproteobacteria bacterium]|nr:hypothetical protein [Deltaproteobacteria bacterium]
MTRDAHVMPEHAAGLVACDANDPERRAAERHAASCTGCAALLARAEQTLALLDAMPAPPPPEAATLARLAASIPAGRASLGGSDLIPPILTSLAALVVVAGAASPHVDGRSITMALSVGVGAIVAMLAARALGAWGSATVVPTTLVASLALALADRHTPLEVPWPKVGCLGIELAVAALPLAATVWLATRAHRRLRALDLAAVASCGALAGQAALVIACPGQPDRFHVLALHVTGVGLAALLGAAAARLPVAAVRAP